LALGLGLALCGLVIRALAQEGPQGALLARQWRERGLQRRALELLRGDLQRAESLRLGTAQGAACALAGREPMLQIATRQGPVTYSLGTAPSAIWRGRVLMRCGTAFGLDGEPSGGQAQNRVVLDGLAADGLRIATLGPALVQVRLVQELPRGEGSSQRITSLRTLATGALVSP
ncbi:MAG: prepilin-type cleavage/methylation domain-containing protein, partial [Cyanobacteriota bacterium]